MNTTRMTLSSIAISFALTAFAGAATDHESILLDPTGGNTAAGDPTGGPGTDPTATRLAIRPETRMATRTATRPVTRTAAS